MPDTEPEPPNSPQTPGPAVMVTGHRELDHHEAIGRLLDHVLTKTGASRALSGGAAGADRLFAEAALRVGVPLQIVLPNIWYRSYYPGVVSDELMEGAVEVTYAVDRPFVEDWRRRWHEGKWWLDNFVRNWVLIERSDLTVVVSDTSPRQLLRQSHGGTAGTVRDVVRVRGEGHKVVWVSPPVSPEIEPNGSAMWVPLVGWRPMEVWDPPS